MASKGNNFAASEGGAMLTNKSSAQSSFGMQNLGKNSAMMKPPSGGQANNVNQGMQNNAQTGSKDNEIQKGQKQESVADQAQKEAVKQAGEAALSAAGVPQPVSKKIIDKAEETGALDKINEEINKFKKKAIMKLLPMLAPVIGWIIVLILSINVISSVIGYIGSQVDKVVEFIYSVVDIASGQNRYYKELIYELPQESYIDKAISQGKTEAEAIRALADAWASVLAPINYKVSEIENPDSGLPKLNFLGKNWIGPCYAATYFAASRKDVCSLTFSGLASSGTPYYNGDSIIDAMKNANCEVFDGGFDKFFEFVEKFNTNLGCATIVDDAYYGIQSFVDHLGTLVGIEEGWFTNAWNNIGDAWTHFWTGQLNTPDHLETRLLENLDYSFDEEAYARYLRDYYLDVRYEDLIEAKMKMYPSKTKEEIKEEIIDDIIIYHGIYSAIFVDEITDEYNKSKTGSSAEEDLMSSLGSIYGSDSCALLETYNPLTHEYTESQGVSNNEIHSVSDGEVIYVKNDTKNLYEYWDSTKQKCICNGITCEDYEGNQIKIKFILENVEFIATYSNLDAIHVNVGDFVSKGQVIATEGNTGCTNMKKLKFQLTSESGINYNTDSLLEKCSSTASTMNACNFNNIKINLVDCNNELIKTLPLYDYIKEKLYLDFKKGIEEPELLKAGAISITSNILANNNYKVGVNEITIKDCNYQYVNINATDSMKLEQAINEIRGEIITYNGKFISTRYNLNCNRTDKDENANSVYNRLCVNKALELAISGKSYSEILEIYYPNYQLNDNYCLNYASEVNKYSMNNNKNYLSTIEETELSKLNADLKSRIDRASYGTRAAVVEAARYLTLGLEGKIPYKNGGKYFEIGINSNWSLDGIDSSGFVSWVLLNGGANIKETLTISKLVKSPNITGSLKINSELYKYYDKIQVGDFAYREDRIGIIIGKNDGILYIAEANITEGLIVTTISSYGESGSNYTHIYFADNYYNGTGNVTSMW